MIYLKNGSVVPVDKSELPIKLPEQVDLNSKGNPLENHPTWKNKLHIKKQVRQQLEKQIPWILLLIHRGIL